MSAQEIDRFIELLQKWKAGDLNWGECDELREFKYQFSYSIQELWDAFTYEVIE